MKTIEFKMDGEGPIVRIEVSFLKFVDGYFVFRCNPGQDPHWKNMKGGVQHVTRSQFKLI